MIIDIHTHITYANSDSFLERIGCKNFDVDTLLYRMDEDGIDHSVILPIINPENIDLLGVAGNMECCQAAQKHSGRLSWFCSVDPRGCLNYKETDMGRLLKPFKEEGALGIGEICAQFPILDPKFQNLFHYAGEYEMPVLMHFAGGEGRDYGILDELGLPGLSQSAKNHPSTLFIGHSAAFWNELDGELKADERNAYRMKPITKKGNMWTLLEENPNLYGDVSAGSGYHALSCNPDLGVEFLERFNKKLFFGTDRFNDRNEPKPPIIDFLKSAKDIGKLSKEAYDNIMYKNFKRVFKI